MRNLISIAAVHLLFAGTYCFAEDIAPQQAPAVEARATATTRPVKQTVDGRRLFDKSVTATKINSESASTGMVLTADGTGKAEWTTLGTSAVFTGNVIGNVTGNLAGDVTGNVTGNVSGSAATFTAP